MLSWLILVGILLPVAPVLHAVDRRLSEPEPRRANVPVRSGRERRPF